MIEVPFTGDGNWGTKAYAGDAGIDLPITKETTLVPGEFADLPSGIRLAIPEGYYGRIVARSSALRKRSVRVYEGIIDAGFRGELFTYVENVGRTATVIKPGDRLAQLIVTTVPEVGFRKTDQLSDSERGEKGFGSSDDILMVPVFDQSPESLSPGLQKIAASATYGKEWPPAPALRPTVPTIYLGGPIDFAKRSTWKQRLILELREVTANWYDPAKVNAGTMQPDVIWARNMRALGDCAVAFFAFVDGAGAYGFGSPIEIYLRREISKPTIVFHDGDAGVYLRKLWMDGLILTDDWKTAVGALREELAKAGVGG